MRIIPLRPHPGSQLTESDQSAAVGPNAAPGGETSKTASLTASTGAASTGAASTDTASPGVALLEESPDPARVRGVTPRVVAVCLILAVLFGYVIPIIDVKLNNTFLGAAHLPPGAVAVMLILLLVVNPLLGLLSERLAFSRNETLTIYISCLFSCLVPGHGAENFIVPNLIGPFYYATHENKWGGFLFEHLPPWFTPAITPAGTYNEQLVQSWYTGIRAGETIPWGAWLVPLLAWGTFILVSYWMLACLSVMLRAQWAEREALAFPLLRLPLVMTEDMDRPAAGGRVGGFFGNHLMWAGAGVAVGIQTLNGLHLYFPDVPGVPLELDMWKLLTEVPWNQISGIPIYIYPVVIGITYLLTTEVSFSLWFFLWFLKLQTIAAYYLGFVPNALPPAIGFVGHGNVRTFMGFQQVGAYLAFVALVLWTAREHLGHIMRRSVPFLGRRPPAGEIEKREALSYPAAFWGFVCSLSFMIIWSVAAGMRLDVALTLWGAYLVVAIALTRVVVEGGLLFVQQGWTPLGTLAQLFQSGPGTWLAPHSLVPASFVQTAMITDLRAFLMPSFVQSFKLAYERGINPRPLLGLICAVIFITLVMSFWMNVQLGYNYGGLQLNGWVATWGVQQRMGSFATLIEGTSDASWLNGAWMGGGALLTFGLTLARSRFIWFPLHPLGYLMCLTYPMGRLWFSIFLGWLAKTIITHYAGTNIYRRVTPFFLGLALGDVTMMLFWLIIDAWQGRIGHQLMPG